MGLLLFVGCLTYQQHASVSQGRICTDNFTCCHTEIKAADQAFHLTQSQYTDNGPTSPSADPITPGAWQDSHWSAQCLSHWYESTPKKIPAQAGFEPGTFRSRGGRLATRPTRWYLWGDRRSICWLTAERPGQILRVFQGRVCSDSCAATLGQKMQITLSTHPVIVY